MARPVPVEAVNDVPPTRDFALPKKKWYGRGMNGGSAVAGTIMGCLPAVFVGIMTASAVGTGGAVGIVAVLMGAYIAVAEIGHRKEEADSFKKLFERDRLLCTRDQEAHAAVATAVIRAMNPEISTDHFIGVMNNLFESKKGVDPEFRGSVNDYITNAQKLIDRARRGGIEISHKIILGTVVPKTLDDKAVSQFLVLNSVVDALMNDRTLLPQVDRQHLVTKFTEFSDKFVEHCKVRYPKKMTNDIVSKIRDVPAAHTAPINERGAAVAGVNDADVAARPNDGGVEVVAVAGGAAPLAEVEVVGGAQLAPPPLPHGQVI